MNSDPKEDNMEQLPSFDQGVINGGISMGLIIEEELKQIKSMDELQEYIKVIHERIDYGLKGHAAEAIAKVRKKVVGVVHNHDRSFGSFGGEVRW